MKILVTDGNNRIALSVIRALGQHGVKISCLEQKPFALNNPICFSSKYVTEKNIIPPIETGFLAINKLLEYAHGHDIILPVSINMILTIVQNRSLFEKEGIAIPYPSTEQIKLANNKTSILDIARNVGISIPTTFKIKHLSELSGLSHKLQFPVVIKLSNDEGLYLKPEKRYVIVIDKTLLEETYIKMHQIKEFPLIQEYIQGEGYGFSALLDNNSNALAFFCHKRLREYPAIGGPSTLCESIYDKNLVEYGIKLLKALNWTGIAMVEFKKDVKDNKFKLMEINPRFWGSLPLAIQSGVNFPYLLCKMKLGASVSPVLRYKLGIKTRFLFLDIRSVFSELQHNRQTKLKTLSEFFRDLLDFNIKDGIFSCSDPRPTIQYLKNHLRLY